MILLVDTADTEILAVARAAESLPDGFPRLRAANPIRDDVGALVETDPPELVIVRLLGGRSAWPEGFDALAAWCGLRSVPFIALGGERDPDPDATMRSRAPSATVLAAHAYATHGGVENWANLLRFASDTLLLTGFGFDAPRPLPRCGVSREGWPGAGGPRAAVVYYRTHWISGNTRFVDDLADALEARGCAVRCVYSYSLRAESPESPGDGSDWTALVEGADVLVTSMLAMGTAGGGSDWHAPVFEALGVPVVQAITTMQAEAEWQARTGGLAPLDAAMQVALPELDGRVVTVPFSFKAEIEAALGTAVTAYRTRPDRVSRVAGIAARLARLRHVPHASKRVVVMLSNYPTKAARIGNAVGLDTPASVVVLLHALRDAGYETGPPENLPSDGDTLIHRLVEAGAHDREVLTAAQLSAAAARVGTSLADEWLQTRIGPRAAARIRAAWGAAPGNVHVDAGDIVVAGIEFGNVFVALQPPRGFGENPIAVYHDPDLPPPHHYLAVYRWLDEVWGADAIVHAGKHGTLEWLPGKGCGLSDECFPDGVLGDVPLVYPFIVNDPGEGTQAKRRAHAVIVDHLIPPMMRAESYDDVARLEGLLDDHAQIEALDPAKLPALREEIWDLIVGADLHTDLGTAGMPGPDRFGDFLLHVDGYLCEVKDMQIRDGLHVLGRPPEGEQEVGLVAALLRLPNGDVPGLRAAAGLADPAKASRNEVDAADAECRLLLWQLHDHAWDASLVDGLTGDAELRRVLRFACEEVVPRLRATTGEIDSILAALDGRFVTPGPAGAPTRGGVHVLPTGRNFYSSDPRSVPTRLAWETGQRLAADLCERYSRDHDTWPHQVGVVVWGTANIRTGGDDIAEILALMGVRPVWEQENRRVTGLELIPSAQLGRPRVDVTVRISGFFRDAFPNVVSLLDDAAHLVASDDPGAGWDPSEPRIFGSKPGSYGAGILPLLDAGNWRSDADLAAVYTAWGGYAYGRDTAGEEAFEAMRRRFGRIEVAVKNQDNREHDIFDSDDYLQYHGGMVATIRSLTGRDPDAYLADSSDPERVRTRTLGEETARVVRARVLNPKWIESMQRHGYKGGFELAATVDYLYGYDATAGCVEDWMYERVTGAYVAEPSVRDFLARSNPWALASICDRLLEAHGRGLWDASESALGTLRRERLRAEAVIEEST